MVISKYASLWVSVRAAKATPMPPDAEPQTPAQMAMVTATNANGEME